MSILVTPNPASVGDHVTVRYTFPPGSTAPVYITVTWDTAGDPIVQQYGITPHNPTVVIEVPEGALGGLAEDDSGGAEDCSITVNP